MNLIPYNNVPDLRFEAPTDYQIKKFEKILNDNKINIVIRRKKGDDINAACGQLRRSKSSVDCGRKTEDGFYCHNLDE